TPADGPRRAGGWRIQRAWGAAEAEVAVEGSTACLVSSLGGSLAVLAFSPRANEAARSDGAIVWTVVRSAHEPLPAVPIGPAGLPSPSSHRACRRWTLQAEDDGRADDQQDHEARREQHDPLG